jgi:hypothetical protein
MKSLYHRRNSKGGFKPNKRDLMPEEFSPFHVGRQMRRQIKAGQHLLPVLEQIRIPSSMTKFRSEP